MRAFASDLDRTLIYSKTMIDMYETDESYELIETIDGQEISYISSKTKESLKQVNENMFFIPVTTRTVEQYKRITLFQEQIQPEFSITSNGGTILQQGTILKEWSELIDKQLDQCMPIDDMVKKIKSQSNTDWIKRIHRADDLFIYLIIHRDKLSPNKLLELKELANGLGWQMSLQGRKLYFVPHPINKWNAVQYLCDKLNIKEVYTAGDSLLDYDLIINGDYGISPAHGEVLEHYPTINKTFSYGMKASNDIMEVIQSKLYLNL